MYTFTVCLAVILTILHLQGFHAGSLLNNSSRTLPLSIARLAFPYPICTPVPRGFPGRINFDADCLGAWEKLLLLGDDFIEKNWKWSRWPKDRPLPPEFQPLPFEQRYNNCAIKIDILGRENTADYLVLFTLGVPMRKLFFECINTGKGRLAAGYIPVGEHLRLKLSIGPAYTSRSNVLRPASNVTTKPPSEHQ